ncbi:MAG: hypothetical protein AB8B47_03120 [Roseobacter sp.]
MATANFQDRIQRIQAAQAETAQQKDPPVRAQGVASIAASSRVKRRHPIKEHFVSVIFGLMLGGLVAVLLIGLTFEGAPWGPGTPWNALAYYPAIGGLALAPVLMLFSLFLAARRPGFALFSLGYLSGVVIPLFI